MLGLIEQSANFGQQFLIAAAEGAVEEGGEEVLGLTQRLTLDRAVNPGLPVRCPDLPLARTSRTHF